MGYNEKTHETFERYMISLTALICAIGLAVLSILGPLGVSLIEYKSSQSAILQGQGQDLINLVLVAPLCLIGGILHFQRNVNAKYFLIMVPLYTLLYTGFAYAIFPEWSHPTYTGNSEQYFWLFLILMIGSLVLLISSLSMFSEDDAPEFNRQSLRIYIVLVAIFLTLFLTMWLSEILEVITTGDTSAGTYQEAPTIFWVIRYLDVGITIPLGYIGLYLLWTRPKNAYPLMLLFFGFFVTLATAVVGMAIVLLIKQPQDLQPALLVIFPALMILAWVGFLYLIKEKLPWFKK